VRTGRALHRKQRSAVPLPMIIMAGYTNAGKSTLFNRLTRAGVLADAKMFATLDPTIRTLILPSRRKVLLGDTVGFIRNLPTTLVKAFRATLEEVAEATLVLHLVDASSPAAEAQTTHVLEVLAEIGAAHTAQLLVLNKADRLESQHLESDRADTLRGRLLRHAEARTPARAVVISALTGEGVPEMLAAIDEVLPFDPVVHARFRLAAGDGARIHMLYELGRVVKRDYTGQFCDIEAEVSESLRERLAEFVVAE
jgi:GTP-binding protein HflX